VRDRLNGWLPVPGWTGRHEWRGYIPWERMPRVIDPEDGKIVTANNRISPEEHGDYLCTDCHPSTRARRISERLDALGSATVDHMQAVLGDVSSARAREIAAQIAATPVSGEAARKLQDMLSGWDGCMTPDALAPSVYYLVRQAMTRILASRSGLDRARHDLFAVMAAPGVIPVNQLWWTLPELLRRNDTSLLGGATWQDVIGEALADVAPHKQPLKPWGVLHRRFLRIRWPGHILNGKSGWRSISHEVAGDGDCVKPTARIRRAGPCELRAGGTICFRYRRLGQQSLGCLPWLVGYARKPTYNDQNDAWARCVLVPAPFTGPQSMPPPLREVCCRCGILKRTIVSCLPARWPR